MAGPDLRIILKHEVPNIHGTLSYHVSVLTNLTLYKWGNRGPQGGVMGSEISASVLRQRCVVRKTCLGGDPLSYGTRDVWEMGQLAIG